MQSYQAARNMFSTLTFFAWCIIGVGGLVAIMGLSSAPSVVVQVGALVSGSLIAVLGFFGLSFVQTSRATVDTAEYTQQALQVSRDQLEISRELLAIQRQPQAGASFKTDTSTPDLAPVSIETEADAPKQEANETSIAVEAEETPAIDAQEVAKLITERHRRFFVGDQSFWSREEAEKHVRETLLISQEN